MIRASFTKNSRYTICPGLWQWDYGQILEVAGTGIKDNIEVHFSRSEYRGDAAVLIAVYDNDADALKVHVPGEFLSVNQSADYRIYAFIYVNDGESGETIYKIILPVKVRPKPIDYDDQGDDAFNATLAEAVGQVNEAKESARISADEARQSAESALGSETRTGELASEIESEVAEAVESAERASSSADAASASCSDAKDAERKAKQYAELAEQEASKAGWIFADVDDSDGHLYITTVGALQDALSFEIDEATGSLEVGYE